MNKEKFASELSKLIKKHNPEDISQAYDMMAYFAGAMIGVAHGVDSAHESPYAEEKEQWDSGRLTFLTGCIYLLATSTPTVPTGQFNLQTFMSGLLPLMVEKAMWEGHKSGNDADVAEYGSESIAELLKAACGVYMTLMYSPTRPDLNMEQLEAKGQDIVDQLVDVFTKASGNPNDN